MLSSEAGFGKVAPSIERLFRFAEMVGVTALLSVVVPGEGLAIRIAGSALAITYLTEPTFDRFCFWIVPEVNNRDDVIRIGVLGLLLSISTILLVPFVYLLSQQLSRTITFSPLGRTIDHRAAAGQVPTPRCRLPTPACEAPPASSS